VISAPSSSSTDDPDGSARCTSKLCSRDLPLLAIQATGATGVDHQICHPTGSDEACVNEAREMGEGKEQSSRCHIDDVNARASRIDPVLHFGVGDRRTRKPRLCQPSEWTSLRSRFVIDQEHGAAVPEQAGIAAASSGRCPCDSAGNRIDPDMAIRCHRFRSGR